jgi:ectoine hydroxylase-related dioxygenase (phytanoyl-CoA dioxygenase family)
MLPDKILSHPPLVLTPAQRAFYFNNGYLVLPNHVPADKLNELRKAMDELIDESRECTESDERFMVDEGHSREEPRLHRVTSPQEYHPAFWSFLTDPFVTDLVADLVGPDVKFHHCKLNVKSGKGSRGIKWHQDTIAHPHTDFSGLAFGVYLNGCDLDQGPTAFIPGSHNGPVYSAYDDEGNFTIQVKDEDLKWMTEDMVDAPTGGPGTVVIINCRVIHGALANKTDKPRPLLLTVYSSADTFPYTPNPIPSSQSGEIVRGKPARMASFDLRPCEIPPDWRDGYEGAWKAQKKAEETNKRKGRSALTM